MAAKSTSGKRNRYLGVQPFRKGDRHLFFGRDEDIENLHDFILLEKIVVLFGKSGYGKSSLLSAGVLPRLTDEAQPAAYRFRTVEARFGNYVEGNSFAPLETLRRILEKEMPGAASDLTNFENLSNLSPSNLSPSLWQLFKQRQFSVPSSEIPVGGGNSEPVGGGQSVEQPEIRNQESGIRNQESGIRNQESGIGNQFLLVFDQFEEFFSYPAEQQEAFRRQLAELLYTDVPQQVRENLDALSPEARSRMATPMNVKAVFSIRSDRMSHLDSMKDALPTILHKRYELRPLTRSQAEAAIVMPARLGHDDAGSWQEQYATPPFEYERPALDAMLGSLALESGGGTSAAGVEAFLLQILCDKVESLVLEGKLPDLDGNGLPDVTADALPDMANLLEDYTQRKLDELDPAQRPAARRLLEDGLLAEDALTGEGRRTSVDGKALLAQFRQQGLSQTLLDDLERTYLLRREPNTVGGFSYEISHDRLVAPVQKMKKERLAKEEKERLKKQQRRLMGIIAVVVLVAGGAIAFGVWAFGQYEDSKQKEAINQRIVQAFQHNDERFQLIYENGEYKYSSKSTQKVIISGAYDEAYPFDGTTGFAQVGVDGKYFLLDTLGVLYRLARNMNELTSETEALDLRHLKLTKIPTKVFDHQNIKILLLGNNPITQLQEKIGALKSLISLDLSGNQLTSLPGEIGQLKSLTELELNIGKLMSLPAEIGQLKRLRSLDLRSNQLTSLPVEIGQLKSLTVLSLGNNKLTSLPKEIGQLQSLTRLGLSGDYFEPGQLKSLPAEIGHLQSLTWLDLSWNQLTSLPAEIGHLQSLTELDLSGNRLTSLPREIAQLKSLTSLDLSGGYNNPGQLNSLPVEIGQLQSLISLNLKGNQLMSLPAEIGQLQGLIGLDLSWNKLMSLPGEIGQLQNLTVLNLPGNGLMSLPEEIEQLRSLTKLDLSGNELTSLPGKIGQLNSLKSLQLQDNQLTSLPVEIGQLQSLTQLYLNENQLTSLPVEIGQLQSLTQLYLNENQLTSLPVEIGQLQSLTELNLWNNQLTSLPSEIGQLNSLKSLQLQDNQFASLPREIGQLKSLTELNLWNNQLTSLPEELWQLKILSSLGLGGNQLTSLPGEIGELKSLTELNLERNQLTSLPVEIGQLQGLSSLNLRGNPISEAEQEIIRLRLPRCRIDF